MTLPMYMLATMPQNRPGFCAISSGPGCRPCTMKAPSSSAITTLGGMPSVSSGMKPPPAAALLAASGPATPSIAPLPNFSGVFETRFSMRVGQERGDHRAAARQHAEHEAEHRAARQRPGALLPVLRATAAGRVMRSREHLARELLLEVDEDLGDAEQAHDDRHQADAVDQLHPVEGQARRPR